MNTVAISPGTSNERVGSNKCKCYPRAYLFSTTTHFSGYLCKRRDNKIFVYSYYTGLIFCPVCVNHNFILYAVSYKVISLVKYKVIFSYTLLRLYVLGKVSQIKYKRLFSLQWLIQVFYLKKQLQHKKGVFYQNFFAHIRLILQINAFLQL